MTVLPSPSTLLMLSLPAVVFLPGCRTHPSIGGDREWRHEVLWKGQEKIQSVAVGDVAREREGLEVIGIDATGRVIMISRIAASSEAEVLYQHGAKLTGLLIANLDPTVSGAEVYVGGYRQGGSGGAVVQLVQNGSGVTSRVVWAGEGFVHALAYLEGEARDTGPALVISTYSGEIHLATPKGTGGPWSHRLLHREPDRGDPEARKIKDVVAGPIGGAPHPRIFVAVKSGRGVLIDPGAPGSARVLHLEPGGIARLALDASGDLFLAGNEGRVLRLTPAPEGWRRVPLYREIDYLRGIATGGFWTPRKPSSLAVFGHTGLCRLLSEQGGGWDSYTVFDDGDRGHWLAAGNVIPGNDSDELVLAGYSGRIVLAYVASTAQPLRATQRGQKDR